MSRQAKTLCVVNSTGKTGKRVMQRLVARGLAVRAGSRSGTPAFDWQSPGSWPAALSGVTAAYVSYHPDLAVPGAVATVRAFFEQAVSCGVEHLVLLSGRGEAAAEQAEHALQECGARWTILRAAWFNQNFSEGSFLEMVQSGEVALPVDTVTEPFVDADDIADVAVAALANAARHAGQLYELTGPRLLTFAEAVTEIAAAAARPIRHVPLSMDEFASMLAAFGEPPEAVALLRYLFTEVLDGRNARLADGVQRALGRAPRDFAAFARAVAASGGWGAATASAGART